MPPTKADVSTLVVICDALVLSRDSNGVMHVPEGSRALPEQIALSPAAAQRLRRQPGELFAYIVGPRLVVRSLEDTAVYDMGSDVGGTGICRRIA